MLWNASIVRTSFTFVLLATCVHQSVLCQDLLKMSSREVVTIRTMFISSVCLPFRFLQLVSKLSCFHCLSEETSSEFHARPCHFGTCSMSSPYFLFEVDPQLGSDVVIEGALREPRHGSLGTVGAWTGSFETDRAFDISLEIEGAFARSLEAEGPFNKEPWDEEALVRSLETEGTLARAFRLRELWQGAWNWASLDKELWHGGLPWEPWVPQKNFELRLSPHFTGYQKTKTEFLEGSGVEFGNKVPKLS